MIVPIPSQAQASNKSASALVVEVEPQVFIGLLPRNEKPLVFEHHAGFPKTYRYYVELADHMYMCRSREKQQLGTLANVLAVKGFHAGPAAVM